MKTYTKDNLPVPVEEMALHRKKKPTPMVMVDGPFTVITEEGPYHLPEGWRGFVAVGPGGHPYAISLESYLETYEPVGTMRVPLR